MSNLESKLETKIDKNLKKFQKETNNQMKKFQEQMKTLTDKIEKLNNIITNVQSEVINVKKDTKTYKQSLGKVNLGKSVSVPEKTTLGVYIRGIPESNSSWADDKLYADLAEVEKLLEHLNDEDKKLTKAQRLGKYDASKQQPRTLLINTENPISRELILRAAHQLKEYHLLQKPVYVNPELNSTDTKKLNECLKKRRELIHSDENQITSKDIWVKILTIEIMENKKWIPLEKSTYGDETSDSETEK